MATTAQFDDIDAAPTAAAATTAGLVSVSRTIRRPGAKLSLIVVTAVAVLAMFVIVVAHFPGTTFTVVQRSDGQIRVDGLATSPTAVAWFAGRDGTPVVRIPLQQLVANHEPRGTPPQMRDFYARRAMIATLLQRGGGTLHLPGRRTVAASAVTRSLINFGFMPWLSIFIGFVAFLAGSWVAVLRPDEWAARMYALSGVGLVIAAMTIASNEYRTLASPAWLMEAEYQVNYLSGFIFGTALVGLFCRYPLALLPRYAPIALGAVLGTIWLAGIVAPWSDLFVTYGVVVLLLIVAMFALFAAQMYATRSDPVARAAAMWIGTALLLSAVVFAAVSLWPQVQGRPVSIPQPVAMSAFLLLYLALAVAVVRYRLFDLGRWAGYLGRTTLVLTIIVVADGAIALVVGGSWSLLPAALFAAALWLPTRQWLVARVERRQTDLSLQLLKGASLIGYAANADKQRDRWRQLLVDHFAPLQMLPTLSTDVIIIDDGRTMLVPAMAGETALALSNAALGHRLFGPADRDLIQTLLQIVSETLRARDAFEAGAQTERERIARDLHDNVGARLLTALHRQSLDPAHAAVREAMLEIRGIIDQLSDASGMLGDLLADLRHETMQRIEAAGLRGVWPHPDNDFEQILLRAEDARHIVAVIRELVTNAIRHARADCITLACTIGPAHELTFTVADDGRGFDPTARDGRGLQNIRRRVEQLAGSMTFVKLSPGLRIGFSMSFTQMYMRAVTSTPH